MLCGDAAGRKTWQLQAPRADLRRSPSSSSSRSAGLTGLPTEVPLPGPWCAHLVPGLFYSLVITG